MQTPLMSSIIHTKRPTTQTSTTDETERSQTKREIEFMEEKYHGKGKQVLLENMNSQATIYM
jgi:hypothetical protein